MIEKNWQALIKPYKLNVNYLNEDLSEAEIVAEPLERGFGMTLGNGLRRILLSSLQGAAISAVKVEGVLHEFSAIDGVQEDMTDIILNLKQVCVSSTSETPKKATLTAKGSGKIYARDITCPAGVEILTPDVEICTLDEDATLNMELTITTGKGYVPAGQGIDPDQDQVVGQLPIDAIYSPVKRVVYKVDSTRVGQRTDYDKLMLRVQTDGSIKPEDAVAYAARILQDQMQVFITFEEPQKASEEEKQDSLPFNKNLLNIFYIGDLVQRSENDMLRTPNFGRKSLNEIKEMLTQMGLGFGMTIDNWPPENIDEMAKKAEDPFN